MTETKVKVRGPVSTALADTLEILPRVLSRGWIPVLVVHILRSVTQELFSYEAVMIQARGREEIGLLAAAITVQFLVEMAWSAVWAFVVIDAVRRAIGEPKLSVADLFHRLNQLVIEGVRSIAAILYRVPLLIVPALFEFVRLTFVPHVVLLDQDYEKGQVDALKRSRQLTKGHWALLILLAAALVGLDTYIEALTQGSTEAWMWEHPVGFSVTLILTFFTNLAYEVFLVALFLKLSMMQALRKNEAA